MSWRSSWQVWAVLAVVSLVAIPLTAPEYVALQNARSAHTFVVILDSPARAVAAAVIDVVFALSYGTLGALGLHRLGRGTPVALVALLTVGFGAAADVGENLYLVADIMGRAHLTNDDLALMQVFGAVKWVAVLGYVVLAVLVLLTLRERWRGRRTAIS